MLPIIRRTGNRVTVVLPEDFDLHFAPALRAVVDRIIDEGCRDLTLDASQTVHLDSTGLTALIIWYRRLTALGGASALTGVSSDIHHLLTRMGLDTALTVTPRPDSDSPL
ncbi:STAS domain-containing protein [Streptomyces sp. NPDC017082]|uniref:STAS domain-containing protein n=1 Tax=unclassified Streptomyces TaxID=2593676 RepID=UPI0034418375